MNKDIITINKLSKNYLRKKSKIEILKDVNFKLKEGEIISIIGPSGSGKSTFLNIIGLLDSDYQGKYFFLDQNIINFNEKKKNNIRNNFIGYVHQFFHLIPELDVLENIALPKMIQTNNKEKSFEAAKQLISKFGLTDRINFKPLNLSGGEQQRVSILRALINEPQLIIADEMTGNLDSENSDLIFNFFIETIKETKKSLIYVTHNQNYANKADKIYSIVKKNIIKL